MTLVPSADDIANTMKFHMTMVRDDIDVLVNRAHQAESIYADFKVNLQPGRVLHELGYRWDDSRTIQNNVYTIMQQLVEDLQAAKATINGTKNKDPNEKVLFARLTGDELKDSIEFFRRAVYTQDEEWVLWKVGWPKPIDSVYRVEVVLYRAKSIKNTKIPGVYLSYPFLEKLAKLGFQEVPE